MKKHFIKTISLTMVMATLLAIPALAYDPSIEEIIYEETLNLIKDEIKDAVAVDPISQATLDIIDETASELADLTVDGFDAVGKAQQTHLTYANFAMENSVNLLKLVVERAKDDKINGNPKDYEYALYCEDLAGKALEDAADGLEKFRNSVGRFFLWGRYNSIIETENALRDADKSIDFKSIYDSVYDTTTIN